MVRKLYLNEAVRNKYSFNTVFSGGGILEH